VFHGAKAGRPRNETKAKGCFFGVAQVKGWELRRASAGKKERKYDLLTSGDKGIEAAQSFACRHRETRILPQTAGGGGNSGKAAVQSYRRGRWGE